MDRFRAIEVFVEVADCGGFAAAARTLSMSPPAVTRFIAGLEEQVGTRLFVRTTRSLRLTESGERFLEDGRRILQDLAEAEESAIGLHASPRGELRITAPVLFGSLHVAPIVGAYLDDYPLVNIQTVFLDRVVNLMDEGLDIAIRIGELADSSMSAIRVGSVRRVITGSKNYFKKNGVPKHPNDLLSHKLIHSVALGASPEWTFDENGQTFNVQIDQRLRMNTNDAILELIEADWGVSRLLSYQVSSQLARGNFQTVLEEYETPPMPVHIVHQEGRMVSSKVRSFVDFMVERLRGNPALST